MQIGKQQAALTKKKTKTSKSLTKLCSDKPLTFRPVQLTPMTRPSSIATVFFAGKDLSFPRTYDCTDHDAIHLSIECPVAEPKLVLQSFRSFGKADYDGMKKFLKDSPFQLFCHTNVNTMCEEFYQYVDKVVETYVPRRTRQRQILPPLISAFTSNLMKKLKTQKKLLERKPTTYRKAAVMKLENLVSESSEADKKDYQEILMSFRSKS